MASNPFGTNKGIEELYGSFSKQTPEALNARLEALEQKAVAQENKLISHRKNFVKVNDLIKEMIARIQSLEKEVETLKKRTHVDPVLWESVIQRNTVYGAKEEL